MQNVVAAVITRGDKYLVIRRGYEIKTFPGKICFPGGRLEAEDDNDLQQAIVREMYEELGLLVIVERVNSVLPYFDPQKRFVVDFLDCKISQASKGILCDLREVDELRWLTLQELARCGEELIPSMQYWIDCQLSQAKGK